MRSLKLIGMLVVIGMPEMASAGPIPPAGFCSGATAPAEDIFEADNERQKANFITALLDTGMPHNFSADADEDWSYFLGKKAGPGATQPLVYAVEAFDFGGGVPMIVENFDPLTGRGSGIVIEVFDTDGSELISSSGLTGCDADLAAQTLDFEVPQQGIYRIRVSQCRNSVDFPGNFCIESDPSYRLRIFSPTGFSPGLLQGVISDSSNGMGIDFALLESTDINNATLSLPVTDQTVSGFYSMADTIDRTGSGFLGSVTAEGYEPADIQFNLAPGQITPCNIQLTPNGQIFVNSFEDPTGPFGKGDPLGCTPL